MFMIEHGYSGTEFITQNNEKLKYTKNFRAKAVGSGEPVIIIFSKETLRDHGASWDVLAANVYDETTLEKVELREGNYPNYEYTWFEKV